MDAFRVKFILWVDLLAVAYVEESVVPSPVLGTSRLNSCHEQLTSSHVVQTSGSLSGRYRPLGSKNPDEAIAHSRKFRIFAKLCLSAWL